jgi:hypothetical protein
MSLSSVLISFLPFVRNEGIIILPIYFCAFLLTGILILSFAGYFYYKDWLWIIHKWPYSDTSEIYGHGDFLFYIKQCKWILGIPLIILFLVGLIYYCDPHIQYFLGVNYFDKSLIKQYLPNPKNPSKDIPEGSFIAWDAHYLANEGMVSKSSLISDSSLKLVKAYQPGDSTTTLGGYNYELLIFLKDSKFSN